MKHLTVSLEQYRYHLQTWGRESSPLLIFLHGFMGSAADFAPVIERFPSEYYCIGIDLPGHGKTQVIGDSSCYQMEAIAASLILVLEQLALPPAHLVGYSMGGRVALYLAIHYPQYFRSVILESASPGLVTEPERRERVQHDEAIAQRLEREDFTHFLGWWYGLPLFQTLRQHPAYGDMLARRQQNIPQELARSLRHLSTGRQPNLWGPLSGLTLPCLGLVGEADHKFVRIGQQMQSRLPALNLQVIQSCGHNIHQENPDHWTTTVHQFIAKKNSISQSR